jgi:hypothetical protein
MPEEGLHIDMESFSLIDDPKERDIIIFKTLAFVNMRVEELCNNKTGLKVIAMKYGAASGALLAFILIIIHDPASTLGGIVHGIIKAILGG